MMKILDAHIAYGLLSNLNAKLDHNRESPGVVNATTFTAVVKAAAHRASSHGR
jgi:hypothetical protein